MLIALAALITACGGVPRKMINLDGETVVLCPVQAPEPSCVTDPQPGDVTTMRGLVEHSLDCQESRNRCIAELQAWRAAYEECERKFH